MRSATMAATRCRASHRDATSTRHLRLFVLLLLAGCADPAAPRSDPAGVPAVLREPLSAQSIAYGQEYSWSQGNWPTYMGKNGALGLKRVCYLTRVSGRFASYGESVRVYLDGDDWILGGTSTTAGIGARARCMIVGDYSVEYGELSGPATHLPHDSEWMCFLTGFRGELAANDRVSVVSPHPQWAVFADGSGGNSQQLWMGARCARPIGGGLEEEALLAWHHNEAPVALAPTDGIVCLLKILKGPFVNANSSASVYASMNSWWIDGDNAGPGAFATSNCFS
jgi:hypothetical protein